MIDVCGVVGGMRTDRGGAALMLLVLRYLLFIQFSFHL
jgi:hypothetical protein